MSAPQKRTRRWRRWLWRVAIAAVVARLLLAVFLTQILGFAAGFAGVSLSMRSASLSLSGLSLQLSDFVVRDPGRPELPPLLQAHELLLDLSMRDLLSGHVVVVDAALASARIVVQRAADGTLMLPASWTTPAPVAVTVQVPVQVPAEAASSPPAPVQFALPVRVLSARLHDVQLRVEAAEPSVPAMVCTVDVDVRDLGTSEKPGELTVRLHAPMWFDETRLSASVTAQPNRFACEWQLAVGGVRPADWNLPAGVKAQLGEVRSAGLSLRGSLSAHPREGEPTCAEFVADARMALDCDGIEQVTLSAVLGPTHESAGHGVATFAVDLAVKDVVQRLQVTDGEVRRDGDETSLSGHLAVSQATLRRLRPWLDELGITVPEAGLGLHASLDATIGPSLSASLRDVVVEHEGETTRWPLLKVQDLRSDDRGLAIGAVEIVGPELTVQRDHDGSMRVAGVRLAAPHAAPPDASADPSPGAPSTAPAPATPPTPPALPHLRLGALAWTGARATFVDNSHSPPSRLQLDELTVRGDGLTVGDAAPPGRLAATVRVAECVESLQIEATLTPGPTSLEAQWQFAGEGISLAGALPWLQPLGLVPELRSGSFHAAATTKASLGPEGTALQVLLDDVRLQDGERTLLRVAKVEGTGVQLTAEGVDVGSWRIDEPFLAVRRQAATTSVCGLQLTGGSAAAAAPAEPAAARPAAAAPALRVGDIVLQGGVLELTDDAPTPAAVAFAAALHGPGDAAGIPFEATLHLDGALDSFQVNGTLSPAARRVEATVAAAGLRGEGLQRLLPPGLRCTLEQGSFDLHALATAAPAPGTGGTVSIDGVRLRDRGEELMALDHFELQVAESSADRLHVSTLNGRGLRAQLAATDAGFCVPGFRLEKVALPPPAKPLPVEASHRNSVAIPLLSVDAVSLACERVVYVDRRGGDGEPLVLEGQLTMGQPWAAHADPESSPPAQLQLRAKALPLCPEVLADIALDPYELAPTADITFAAKRIDLTALPRLSPRLAATLQGTTNAAELAVTLHARLDWKRRDNRHLDLAHALGGEFVIEDLQLSDPATGKSFLSIGSIEAIARAIDPGTGDVLLRSLEIADPHVDIVRGPLGVELLGVRLLPKPAGASAPPAPSTPPVASAPTAAAPEFAVDRLLVQGLRVGMSDTTTEPPTLLPIADGELSMHQFSTRTLSEPRPFSFALTLRGGDVPLDRRRVGQSVFAGMLGSARAAVGAADRIDSRPGVDELTVAGELELAPRVRGHLRATIAAFELAALRGLAKKSGIVIDDGLLDQDLTVDLRGPDGMDVNSNQVFTYLSLSEPPGGPISTYLRLPAPLDTVLFLLRNDDGEHRIPIKMTVPSNGLQSGEARDMVAELLAKLIAEAVASSPIRAAGVITGVFDFSNHTPATATVPFAPGDPLPAAHDLRPLLDALAGDDQLEVVLAHELGAGDLEHAARLATPTPEQVARQAETLRQRRQELLLERGPLATAVDTLYAAGRMQEARWRQAELVAHDTALGELERTLDATYDMLTNDSPRAVRRRTQAAATALGAARLTAMQAALHKALPNLAAERIALRPSRGTATPDLPAGGQILMVTRRRTVH